MFFVLIIIPCLTLLFASRAGSETSSCPKGEVTIVGILHRGEFFGSPGWGENIKTDALGFSYYLQLPTNVNEQIVQNADFVGRAPNCSMEHFIQIGGIGQDQLDKRLGKKLKVTGTLYQSATGYDHTRVLLEVRKVKVINSLRE
jgi:hypothetical protein